MASAVAGESSQNTSPRLPPGMPLIRIMAMPADANPNGDIFGGWLLSQMDLAGGSLAAQRARGRCATVAVDGMVFHEPVFVGDEVRCYGELVKTGRTSMTVRIEAWRRHLPSDEARKVTEAIFTYVAIGKAVVRAGCRRRSRRLPARSARGCIGLALCPVASAKKGAVAEPSAADVIVTDFDHQFGTQGLPTQRSVRCSTGALPAHCR